MGRARKPGSGPRQADAYGPGYGRFTARLWGTPPPEGFRGLPCAFCGEPITPGLGQVDHRIPPAIAPQLAQARGNVRPCHGGGRRRSPSGLACNSVAAGNLAPKDSDGYPAAPWPEDFKLAAIERAQARDRTGASSVTRRNPGNPRQKRPGAPGSPRQRVYPAAGRAW